MKFMHISDLHLGKTLQGYSIYEDQKHMLEQLVTMAEAEEVDGILVAGDIYDRAIPSGEAMVLFDRFLTRLVKLPKKPHIFVIYGNHDGVERLIYGRKMLEELNIHFSPVYTGQVEPVCIEDEFGPIHVYLLPFLHPHHVQDCAEGEKFKSYQEAIAYAVDQMSLDDEVRNILVTHQFFADGGKAERSDSELNIRGGTEMVDVSVVEHFDYVALGHLHKPQYVGSYRVRYSGSPLKYSMSEATNEKTVTFVEMKEKGTDLLRKHLPITPLRDLVALKGTLKEIVQTERVEQKYQDCYVYVRLTDEKRESGAVEILRSAFPYFIKHEYTMGLNLEILDLATIVAKDVKDPFAVCKEFFENQLVLPQEKKGAESDGGQMDGLQQKQTAYLQDLIKRVWGDEV